MTKVFLTEGISSMSRAILAGASVKEIAAQQGKCPQAIRNNLQWFLNTRRNVKTCRGTALEKVKHILQNYECIMPPERDVTGLTEREQEILELFIKCGADYKKTAQAACVEICTIKAHFINIFSKFQVNSKAALAIKYFTEIKNDGNKRIQSF